MLRQALLLPLALGAAAQATSAQQSENPPTGPDGTWLVALRDGSADAATESQPWTLRYTAVQDERQPGMPGAEEGAQDESEDEEKSGFLYGLRKGFEKKPRPIDSPLYFEDPYINTEVRFIYLYHTFPKSSVLGKGDLQVAAVQARVALTDRIQFIATEDGYSWLDTDAFGSGEDGWNDLAVGLKGALLVDEEKDFILSVGGRYTIPMGNRDILKGLAREWSIFTTAAKGWNDGKTNLIGSVNFRQPFNQRDGNTIINWDAHKGYIIKMGSPAWLFITGYEENEKSFTIPAGWNDIPVLSNTGVDSDDVFLPLGSKLVIATEIAGSKVYWPALGIFSLDILYPGKSYYILLNESATLEFP